ncbi:AAA family ATPase [Pelagibacterales bacterium SAG-MED19]|nr:AAA family ATPase [Pelagibacterales bacterium SAG-MED19]
MNLIPKNQLELFEYDKEFINLINLYENKKFPTKILLSGQKGLGKCTLAYHLINYILSNDEDFPYDKDNFKISENNKSYRLIQNGSNPNFDLIDILPDKKNIDINQIRDLILKMNKSSFNSKPRFILIDNVENLNKNSSNALLKSLEEPNENIYFILIKNEKKILPTIESRCLSFKISKSNDEIKKVVHKIFKQNITELLDPNLFNYYFTPGKIYNLIKFSNENKIDIKSSSMNNFLSNIIDKNLYKKDQSIKTILYEFIETIIISSSKITKYKNYNYFIKRINDIRKFNLDEESLFIEFKSKILNG